MSVVVKIKIKKIIHCFIVSAFLLVLLIFPSYSSEGVKNGLNYGASILIPSLFPFMVLSSFVMRSGFSEFVGKIFSPVTKFIFGLPSICSACVILSFVGGFPIGAKCVQLLYDEKKINIRQAQRLMMFCVCSGPAFLITAVGTIMLNNINAGIILYVSQIISGLILGIVSRIIFLGDDKDEKVSYKSNNRVNLTSAFILSCSDGAKAIIEMTALVLIFSLFINVFEKTNITECFSGILSFIGISKEFSNIIIPSILEVTGACTKICSGALPLWVMSGAVGFGGLCVHLQIFDILKDIKIKKAEYFSFRVINAFLSSFVTYVICLFYQPVTETFSSCNSSRVMVTSSSIAGMISLILMSTVFLFSISSKTNLKRLHKI